MKKSLIAFILAFALLFTLGACSKQANDDNKDDIQTNDEQNNAENENNENNVQEQENNTNENVEKPKINIGFLKGPTGVGAAYLMDKNASGETAAKYNITLDTDVSNINSAIISGELDMAAVPTNVASILYNKTDKNVQIVAINTLGVLYILENGNSIESIADLVGKTIYATGQGSNPQYVLEHILEENGLTVGEDVFVEYLASDELATQMAAGTIEICMLPVPNATSVIMKNSDVRMAINLTDEWEAIGDGSILTQGCIVARADKVDDAMLEAFLADYSESIEYMSDENNLDDAASLAVKYEIIASEQIAKAAIPDCNLVYIADADTMREYLTGYFATLFAADPTSIGGNLPDDEFYR